MDATATVTPPASVAEQVKQVLADAKKPMTAKQVKTAVHKLYPKGTKKPTDDAIRAEVEKAGVHEHPKTKGGDLTYWHTVYTPPPTPAELVARAVREKVAGLGDDEVVPDSKLGKPTKAKATPETIKAFDDTLNQLVENGELHRHGAKYGKKKPPPPPPPLKWYEKPPHKAKFAKFVTSANTLFSAAGVTADEFLTAIRHHLGQTPAETPKPVVVPPPVVSPPVHTDLRAVLKQAYDHLCQFVEFRDRLVELPRLYREAVKRLPSLAAEAFKAELWQMNEERRIQLHVLNEVREAKESHLAIHRNDRLYYYLIWN